MIESGRNQRMKMPRRNVMAPTVSKARRKGVSSARSRIAKDSDLYCPCVGQMYLERRTSQEHWLPSVHDSVVRDCIEADRKKTPNLKCLVKRAIRLSARRLKRKEDGNGTEEKHSLLKTIAAVPVGERLALFFTSIPGWSEDEKGGLDLENNAKVDAAIRGCDRVG
jgi:hypothetical protein